MSRLVNGVGQPIAQGQHQYIINITSGSVTLSVSTDEGANYQDMTNGVFSSSEDGILLTADAYIKAVMTGVATVSIGFVRK